MAAASISSYRDRTSEFRALSEILKKIAVNSAGNRPSTVINGSQITSSSANKSEFNKKASRTGLGIHEANRKIARLSQCNYSFHNLIFHFPNFLLCMI